MKENFIKFPSNFMWGGAGAAEQTEGKGNTGKADTIWDEHFNKYPKDFWNGIGPHVTSDFFNQYDKDMELFSSFNANSYRLGISWARLIPDGENISSKGLEFYWNVIKSAKKNGIKLILNLFHFDMPLWAHNKGNWASREVIEKFVYFADVVFSNWSSEVEFIATFNEPGVPVLAGYLGSGHWPKVQNNQKAIDVSLGMILAHSRVVDLFHKKYSNKKAEIGAVINVNPPIVKDGITGTIEDEDAAKIFDMVHNNMWLYPMIKGEWPEGFKDFLKDNNIKFTLSAFEEKIIAKTKLDFLGTNFYAPSRIVASNKKNPKTVMDKQKGYHYDKARYNIFRGWEIRPESLYDLAMIIKNDFNNIKFFVSENGMGVEDEERFRDETGEIQDTYRIAFLKEHLIQLKKAMENGANCFGYHMWAMIDNWSWRNSYKNRYGFIEYNLKNKTRRLKKSARWFKIMVENNGFIDDGEKIEDSISLE